MNLNYIPKYTTASRVKCGDGWDLAVSYTIPPSVSHSGHIPSWQALYD